MGGNFWKKKEEVRGREEDRESGKGEDMEEE